MDAEIKVSLAENQGLPKVLFCMPGDCPMVALQACSLTAARSCALLISTFWVHSTLNVPRHLGHKCGPCHKW